MNWSQAENFILSQSCPFLPAPCPWIIYWFNALALLVSLRQKQEKKFIWLLSGSGKSSPSHKLDFLSITSIYFGFRNQQRGKIKWLLLSFLPYLPWPPSRHFRTLCVGAIGIGGEDGRGLSGRLWPGMVGVHRWCSLCGTVGVSSESPLTAGSAEATKLAAYDSFLPTSLPPWHALRLSAEIASPLPGSPHDQSSSLPLHVKIIYLYADYKSNTSDNGILLKIMEQKIISQIPATYHPNTHQ